MKVVAEILTGSLFYVEVGDDATVGDLKKQIGKQENLPGNRLMLLLDSERCYLLDKDEASLKYYGVEDSSHIYIIFKPHDCIASFSASPSTPKEYASIEPSRSMDSSSGPPNSDTKDDQANDYEASFQETASDEANEPSASVDQEE